jgi:hypothetical protein
MRLVNGQIISRPVLNFPFLAHYGVVADAERRIVVDYGSRGKRYVPLNIFMANRKKYKLYDSDVLGENYEVISGKFDLLPEKQFSWLTNNCVQFMSHFGRPDLAKQEVRKFVIFMLLLATLMYLSLHG